MSAPGWYPDPGGQPGMFRYWDGSVWSAALSPTPHAGRPSSVGPGPQTPGGTSQGGPGGPGGNDGSGAGGNGGAGGSGVGGNGGPGQGSPGSGNRAWVIAAAAVVVVLVVVVAFIVRNVTNNGSDLTTDRPGGSSTRPVCPPQDSQTPDAAATRDGRVYGGKLSYPQLSAPWTEPRLETRVPFGRNAWTQTIHVEDYVSGSTAGSWVASVLVAELNAGDGFYNAQDGSEIVVTCIVGAFYGEAKVDRKDRVNKAMTVDGHAAWLVESDLEFSIPGLRTDGELAIVLIVETGPGSASVYYASIPNTTPQWEAPARQAMAQLTVDD
ncbi:DUF2510 domain-containing protein [Ammonicoccus fulvus]|uniref:DUF2510 domain-containing protein n=1 Tax=Ammonicoccus fulvus TaxID=3138240 RepID=A0ABZ3FKZ4_9ACTN